MAEEQPNQVRENEPPDLGYAEPDTGQGDVESEIPEGVESLSDEAVAAAEERGGGDEGDDGGAIDVSAVMAEEGDDASGDAEAEGDDDAEATGDAEGEADADAEGTAADEAGEDATEKTDVEAQVAPDTGEDA